MPIRLTTTDLEEIRTRHDRCVIECENHLRALEAAHPERRPRKSEKKQDNFDGHGRIHAARLLGAASPAYVAPKGGSIDI